MKRQQQNTANHSAQTGQALLTMLIFMSIGITMLTAATIVLVTNIFGSVTSEQSMTAYYAAESGAEDGLLHVLRNPSYNGTLPPYAVGEAQTSVTITNETTNGSTNATIIATGTYQQATRTVEIKTATTNGAVVVTSWQEID
jgi:hypothetical protein